MFIVSLKNSTVQLNKPSPIQWAVSHIYTAAHTKTRHLHQVWAHEKVAEITQLHICLQNSTLCMSVKAFLIWSVSVEHFRQRKRCFHCFVELACTSELTESCVQLWFDQSACELSSCLWPNQLSCRERTSNLLSKQRKAVLSKWQTPQMYKMLALKYHGERAQHIYL